MKLRYFFIFTLSVVFVDLSMLLEVPGLYNYVFTHTFGSTFSTYQVVPLMAIMFLAWIAQTIILMWLLIYHT